MLVHSLLLFDPGATTLGQSGPGSDGNEEVVHIPQSSDITRTSTTDCLASYQEHSLRKSYLSAEVQLVYSTAPANWAIQLSDFKDCYVILIIQFNINHFFCPLLNGFKYNK